MANNDSMKIMMCGNENVFAGIMLCVLSLTKHTARPITLYIGTMELTDIDERYRPITGDMANKVDMVLKRANPNSEVRLLDFSESFRRELIESKNLTTNYTPYAMIRLFAPEIDGNFDKLLYLDTDVMLLGDISELYDIDLRGRHMAGVRDYFGKFFFGNRYLNSGVLLFNMPRMKSEKIFEKARDLCNRKRMLLFDQHALNKYAKDKLILHRRFNEQKSTRNDSLIRHFAMTIKWLPFFHTETVKPWHRERIHSRLHDYRFDDIFEEYDRIISDTCNV